jgi:hypothetical protein
LELSSAYTPGILQDGVNYYPQRTLYESSPSNELSLSAQAFFEYVQPSLEYLEAAKLGMLPGSTASHEPLQIVPCQFRCADGQLCSDKIHIRSDDMSGLRTHLELVHVVPKPHKGQQVTCQWNGCVCTAQGSRGARCVSKRGSHPAHVDNVAQHIWNTHLGFRFMCGNCGAARWSSAFARDRHRYGKRDPRTNVRVGACTGRNSARCQRCCREFASEAELEGHLSLGYCLE